MVCRIYSQQRRAQNDKTARASAFRAAQASQAAPQQQASSKLSKWFMHVVLALFLVGSSEYSTIP